MTTTLKECPIACPCPCPCPLPESNQARKNTWGFTETCPDEYLKPGQVISSPGGRFSYKILSYPFSKLDLDFRGLIAHAQGHKVFDTSDRQYWKCLFLLLADATARGELHLPPWLVLGLTGRFSPHLDNNAWEGWPVRRPVRNLQGNFLSYFRQIVGGETVEVFTVRWSPKKF